MTSGVFYREEIKEYEIVINGEVIGWDECPTGANARYLEALRVHKDHVTRNPANDRLFPQGGAAIWPNKR